MLFGLFYVNLLTFFVGSPLFEEVFLKNHYFFAGLVTIIRITDERSYEVIIFEGCHLQLEIVC